MLVLAALLIIVFAMQAIVPGFTDFFILDPTKPLELWRIVSSIFLHGGLEHILFNLLSLVMFGAALTRIVGNRTALWIFFIGGIIGNLAYLAFTLSGFSPPVPALGASGGIYAILGAVAVFLPDAIVYIYFFPVKMKYAVVLWVLMNIFFIAGADSGIAGQAHLGGLAFGLAYAYYLKNGGWIRPAVVQVAPAYPTSEYMDKPY
jgi:uncharacterized protein